MFYNISLKFEYCSVRQTDNLTCQYWANCGQNQSINACYCAQCH